MESVLAVWLSQPISARIAFIIWFLYLFMYWFFYRYEKYNGLKKNRVLAKRNWPHAMYAFLTIAILIEMVVSLTSSNKTFAFSSFWPNAEIYYEWAGLTLMALGLVCAAEGRARLNGFWGPGIFTYNDLHDQRFVKEGIYSKVRHPIYASQIVMAIGTVLFTDNYLLTFFPVLTALTHWWRARQEDNDLFVRFGGEFQKYKDTTNAFWP